MSDHEDYQPDRRGLNGGLEREREREEDQTAQTAQTAQHQVKVKVQSVVRLSER